MLFKSSNAHSKARKPAVEGLLQSAHASFDRLHILRARVAASGIDMDALPDDVVLGAFALLGNYARGGVAERVSPKLAILMDKGLIENTEIEALPTPMLRLFAHIEHLLDDLLDISQRIEAGIAAWQDGERALGAPAIRCVAMAAGFYGQEIRLKVQVNGAEWLLVRPDAIFGLAETLLRVEPDCPATIPLPCDDGEVLLAAMAPSGDVSVHAIRLSILQEAP